MAKDLVEVADTLYVFNLGYDPYIVSAVEIDELTKRDYVLCRANEGSRDEIYFHFYTEENVSLICGAHIGHIERNVGDVDTLVSLDDASLDHLTDDLLFGGLLDAKNDHSVVHKHLLTLGKLGGQILIGN